MSMADMSINLSSTMCLQSLLNDYSDLTELPLRLSMQNEMFAKQFTWLIPTLTMTAFNIHSTTAGIFFFQLSNLCSVLFNLELQQKFDLNMVDVNNYCNGIIKKQNRIKNRHCETKKETMIGPKRLCQWV